MNRVNIPLIDRVMPFDSLSSLYIYIYIYTLPFNNNNIPKDYSILTLSIIKMSKFTLYKYNADANVVHSSRRVKTALYQLACV